MSQYQYFHDREMRRTEIYNNIPCNYMPRRSPARPVYCIDTGIKYKSVKDAAAAIGRSHETVKKACQGNIKSVAGYHFRYVMDGEK